MQFRAHRLFLAYPSTLTPSRMRDEWEHELLYDNRQLYLGKRQNSGSYQRKTSFCLEYFIWIQPSFSREYSQWLGLRQVHPDQRALPFASVFNLESPSRVDSLQSIEDRLQIFRCSGGTFF